MNNIKNILFDLDGTLLPMDMDVFTKGYFSLLAKKAAGYGYEPEKLIETVWAGVKAMVKNCGPDNNEKAFWNYFVTVYGEKSLDDRHIFDEFYANEFDGAKQFVGFNAKAKEAVDKIKEKGFNVYLATNPLFPEVATKKRAEWAGFELSEFLDYTTYENSSACKPNPMYYEQFLAKNGLKAEECIMVGNDVEEDMEAAKKVGMQVFLITDTMLNPKDRDINDYENGSFDDLLKCLLQ